MVPVVKSRQIAETIPAALPSGGNRFVSRLAKSRDIDVETALRAGAT